MDTNKELDRLSGNLHQVQDKLVNQWLGRDSQQYLEEQRQLQEEQIKKSMEEMAKLKELMKGLKETAENNQKVIEERREKTKALKDSVDSVKKETDDILRDREVKEAALEDLMLEMGKTKELMETQDKVTSQRLKELQTAGQWFVERLALKFKKVAGDELQFVFTCIDKADPNRAFYFSMKLDHDGKYQVFNCEPAVKNLEELVEKLNKTNNLRSFTICMRRLFKEMT